jgi:hypothetical protein
MSLRLVANFAFVLIAATALGSSVSLSKPKRDPYGCTVKQLQSVSEAQCPSDFGHHIECSAGGTISCCNDEVDQYGPPVGFCLDLNKAGHPSRKLDLNKTLQKIQ